MWCASYLLSFSSFVFVKLTSRTLRLLLLSANPPRSNSNPQNGNVRSRTGTESADPNHSPSAQDIAEDGGAENAAPATGGLAEVVEEQE